MNLAFGAQSLEPGDEHLVNFFLGQQFADFGGDFSKRNVGSAGLFQLGDKLIAVVGFDGFGIDLHSGTKAGIDEAHYVNLLLDVGENIFFGDVIARKK